MDDSVLIILVLLGIAALLVVGFALIPFGGRKEGMSLLAGGSVAALLLGATRRSENNEVEDEDPESEMPYEEFVKWKNEKPFDAEGAKKYAEWFMGLDIITKIQLLERIRCYNPEFNRITWELTSSAEEEARDLFEEFLRQQDIDEVIRQQEEEARRQAGIQLASWGGEEQTSEVVYSPAPEVTFEAIGLVRDEPLSSYCGSSGNG